MPAVILTVPTRGTTNSSPTNAGGSRRSTTSTKHATGGPAGVAAVSLRRRRICVPHHVSVRAFQPARAANSDADAPLLCHDATRRAHSAAVALVLAMNYD